MDIKIKVSKAETYEETTQKGNVLHKQQCELPRQGRSSVFFCVNVEKGKPYPVGDYTLDVGAFRASRFEGLEIDPYNVRLVSVAADRSAVKA